MSSRTSSRSTLTMVPSTMSPSLKYLMVLSMAARKSSLEPMSLTATCGEATEGLGMLLGCSGQVGVVGTIAWCYPRSPRESPVEATRLCTSWTTWVPAGSYPAVVSYPGTAQQPCPLTHGGTGSRALLQSLVGY